MSDDVEDILGPPPKRGRGRPPGSKNRKPHPPLTPFIARPTNGSPPPAAASVSGGVTIAWLAKAFGMEVSTVRKRMADCPPLAKKTSGYTYAIKDAAQYLVRPRVDLKQYLRELRPQDLPEQLRPSFWEAEAKRLRVEKAMRQLWYTDDVMAVFAEVFKAIKFTIQLWPDTLERQTGLSNEDRKALTEMSDQLQEDIFSEMEKLAKERSTPSAWERFLEQTAGDDADDVEDIL